MRTWSCLLRGLSLCVLAAVAPQLDAQILYGSLVGNVKDPSNAAIPGVVVTVRNVETNRTREVLTNDAGGFTFATLAPGTYEVEAKKEGFRPIRKSNVAVSINSITRADLQLELGQVVESVTVEASAATLQTDRSEVRAEVTSQTLENVPVPLGRNYQQLFVAIPGFTPPANAHSIPSNPSRALVFNVNGASYSSNNVRIDGASSTNVWLPHASAYVPALESIQTVNVVTNSFDAEQGLAGGAAINVQIKSGTNNLHGSAFEYHSDNKMKARPFFNPPGERNPKRVYNQFGATLGGPIKKDKLFFFTSYEGTLDRQFAARLATIPSAAIRQGDMSASPQPIYDPNTGGADGSGRTPFPNKMIPEARIDSIAKKIAGLWPQPTYPDALTSNYYANAPFAFDRHTLDTKLTWNATSKLNTYARYSYLKFDTLNQPYFGDALIGPPINGGNVGYGFGATHSGTLAATYVPTPSLVIDAYFGYTLMDTNVEQPRLDEKIGLEVLAIPGTNGPRRFEGGWPRLSISSYTTIGVPDDFMPYYRTDPQYQYVLNANWTKGTHNLRFGTDIYRQNLNHTQPEFSGASHGAQGGFSFGGGPTQIKGGASGNQFNSFSTFLLGLPTTVGKILQVPDEYSTRTWSHSFYARDQWQVSRKLTMSLGVRYELFPMPTRKDRGLERYDPVNNKMLVCGVGVVPTDCGVHISQHGFAPRLGVAYRATDTFVIRAGYGITNDPFNLARNLRTNHPILLAFTLSPPNSFQPAGLLRDGIPALQAPDLGNGIIDVPGTVGVNYLSDEFRRGYIQSWNFMLQKELGKGFTGQAGYVATRQVRQLGFLNVNTGRPGGGRNSQPFYQQFGRTASTQVITGLGGSHYDSLQATLERRFSNGLQLQVGYTWSKSIGICCNDNSDGSPAIKLPDYYHLNRSLSGFDRTHEFNVMGITELPFGRRKPWLNGGGLGSALAGGWQLNWLFTSYSGTPFSVSASGTSLDAPGNTQRADQVRPEVEKLGGVGRGQSFFDPLAFAPVTQARFGTAGFRSLRGPGLVNLDLGLFREFRMSERFQLQFRAEAFNFTNTPHFSNPGTNVSNLQLNSDRTIRSLGGFTEITGTTGTGREGIDERLFRVGLRLSF